MLQRLKRSGLLVTSSAIYAGLVSCQSPSSEGFWEAGKDYVAALRVQHRPALTPELSKASFPLADTATVRLHVLTAVNDSLTGTFIANLVHTGLMVGAVGDTVQRFKGKTTGRDVTLRLAPDATDAGMEFVGRLENQEVKGTWTVQSGSTAGTFSLQSAGPPVR